MSAQIFVDETKRGRYLLVAAVVLPTDLHNGRKLVRSLLLPGQRRLHMKNERDSRRRTILSAFVSAGITSTIYDAGGKERSEIIRRGVCLRAIVEDAARDGHQMLVLERDETLVARDRQSLIEYVRAAGCQSTLRYEHRTASEELLLCIPDAIAWAYARGGEWRQRVDALVADVRRV